MSPKLTQKKRLAPAVVGSSRWRLVGSLIVVVLAAYIALGESAFWTMGAKRDQLSELQAQVTLLQAERDSLKNVLWRLENDMSYVEKVAREEYGMSKKGERVYALPAGEGD